MDVGGNTHARDTERLLKVYDWCMFHVYEPIPEYHASLTKYYSGDQFRKSVRIHPFGIGNTTHQMAVSKRDLAGESTFLGKNTAGTIRLYIKSMEDALAQLEVPQVSLLHMNCEGCEWEVLTSMGEAGMFSRFVYIQFSAHNYGLEGVGVRGIQLCKIREYLSRTHSMHKGVPFGWERWVRNQ
jgi:FkbM family methyltransferase